MKSVHKITFLLAAVFVFFAAVPINQMGAHAAEVYSGVMEDLGKDPSFNAASYPAVESDNSLKVITIAESVNDELFVYVYQPCDKVRDLRAVSIRIATQPVKLGGESHDFKLTLLDSEGVFDKYRVEGLAVSRNTVRCYEIIQITRKWFAGIDDPSSDGQTVSEVPFRVAQLWTAITAAGNVFYECVETDVVEVTEKRCGYLRYNDGFAFLNTACFSHYVAFDTDYAIDRLYEADVNFVSQAYSYNSFSTGNPWVPGTENTQYEDPVTEEVTLRGEDQGEYSPGGWLFLRKYQWNRIQSVEEFIASETSLTEEAKNDLRNMKWVLRFTETEYWANATANTYNEKGTYISDVTILRLYFETAGTTYDLGVVDNKQTESPAPDNDPGNASPNAWFWQGGSFNWGRLFAIVALVLFIILLAPVLPYLVQGLIWIVGLPFRLIKKGSEGIENEAEKPKKEETDNDG